MAFCTNCGADVGDARFCTNCGTKVERQTLKQPVERAASAACENAPEQQLPSQRMPDEQYDNEAAAAAAVLSADAAEFGEAQGNTESQAPAAPSAELPTLGGTPECKNSSNPKKKKILWFALGGIVLAAAVVAVLCIFVFGKNKGKKEAGTAGYYVLTYMKTEGIELNQDDLKTLGFAGHLILEKDGTGKLAFTADELGDQVSEISWTEKAVTVDGESVAYTLEDGVLTLEEDGQIMKFTRSSEEPPVLEVTEPASGTADPSLAGKYVMTQYLIQGEAQELNDSWYELFADGTGKSYDVGEWEFTWFVLDGKVYMRDENGNETVAELQDGALVITSGFFDTVCTYTLEGTTPTAPDTVRAGLYVAEQMQSSSGTATKDDLAAMGIRYTLLLEEDGTGEMSYGDSMRFAITWTETGLSYGGETMEIAFEGDCVTVHIDESTSILYRKSSDDPTAADATDYWNNSWYGYLLITYGAGDFEGWDNGSYWWDCCAKTGILNDGMVHMILWDEEGSVSEPFSEAQFTIDQDGTPALAGRLLSDNGYFYEETVLKEDWVIDPADAAYDNMIYIHGRYTSPDNAESFFEYSIVLRPWGTRWDDWYADDATCLPEYYESWYLPLLEQGVTSVPDTIG